MGDTGEQKTLLTDDLEENIERLRKIFKEDETLNVRYAENQSNPSVRCCILYIDSMVDNKLLNDDIIKPFVQYPFKYVFKRKSTLIDAIAKRITLSNSVERVTELEAVIQGIVYGDAAMLLDGCAEALILNSKGWETRAISEPQYEKVLRGPREGFNESLMANLVMLRRRIRTKELKMKFRSFGTVTQTKGCLCYIEGVVNKAVLAEIEKRLEEFTIDAALDVNYITEFIADSPYSPIQTTGSTERPDVVAAKLLEGRVALFLDGTPVVLTMPHLFIEHFQSNDDYYLSYIFASIGRLLRIFSFFISTSIPAIYVSLTCFHHEMLPTPLITSIAAARQNVPMPTVVEAFVMLIMFEILRETGNRIPSSIGQSLSVVGALVVGQAAVDAKLVSSPMIVIVATSGITGLLIPRIKGAIIVIRSALLILSSVLGFYGYLFGMMGLLIYLFTLESFGIPIMTGSYDRGLQDKKDIFIRVPWPLMKNRPRFLAYDKVRVRRRGGSE